MQTIVGFILTARGQVEPNKATGMEIIAGVKRSEITHRVALTLFA